MAEGPLPQPLPGAERGVGTTVTYSPLRAGEGLGEGPFHCTTTSWANASA